MTVTCPGDFVMMRKCCIYPNCNCNCNVTQLKLFLFPLTSTNSSGSRGTVSSGVALFGATLKPQAFPFASISSLKMTSSKFVSRVSFVVPFLKAWCLCASVTTASPPPPPPRAKMAPRSDVEKDIEKQSFVVLLLVGRGICDPDCNTSPSGEFKAGLNLRNSCNSW